MKVGPEKEKSLASLRETLKKIANWKVPGNDGFRFKRITPNLHKLVQ